MVRKEQMRGKLPNTVKPYLGTLIHLMIMRIRGTIAAFQFYIFSYKSQHVSCEKFNSRWPNEPRYASLWSKELMPSANAAMRRTHTSTLFRIHAEPSNYPAVPESRLQKSNSRRIRVQIHLCNYLRMECIVRTKTTCRMAIEINDSEWSSAKLSPSPAMCA